jgi:hypothetical protein
LLISAVVDPLTRKGDRFKGVAAIFNEGTQFEEINDFYRRRGSTTEKQHFVLVKIERAAPLISPAYDLGESERQNQHPLATILGASLGTPPWAERSFAVETHGYVVDESCRCH